MFRLGSPSNCLTADLLEQRPTRPHEAPSDVPPARNADASLVSLFSHFNSGLAAGWTEVEVRVQPCSAVSAVHSNETTRAASGGLQGRPHPPLRGGGWTRQRAWIPGTSFEWLGWRRCWSA